MQTGSDHEVGAEIVKVCLRAIGTPNCTLQVCNSLCVTAIPGSKGIFCSGGECICSYVCGSST